MNEVPADGTTEWMQTSSPGVPGHGTWRASWEGDTHTFNRRCRPNMFGHLRIDRDSQIVDAPALRGTRDGLEQWFGPRRSVSGADRPELHVEPLGLFVLAMITLRLTIIRRPIVPVFM